MELTPKQIIDFVKWIQKEQWTLANDNRWYRMWVIDDMLISDTVLWELYLRDLNK